jgi:hypothetical protein
MDTWIVEEKATIKDDVLKIVDEGHRYKLSQAVHFVADVGDGSDPHKLVGRVKELETLAEIGAEHYMDSVLIEDSAYKVVPGFTGEPIIEVVQKSTMRSGDISGAVMTQAGEDGDSEDTELLAKFLLDNL